MAPLGAENNIAGANPDFHTIRQQIRANVLQKSKEKQEKKMMVSWPKNIWYDNYVAL